VHPPRQCLPSHRSFFQYKSTAMIPPIVSLGVRRSMVQKFGITVSTIFNRESTHNVECVGLDRLGLSIGGSRIESLCVRDLGKILKMQRFSAA
jgi:hypothetical protein